MTHREPEVRVAFRPKLLLAVTAVLAASTACGTATTSGSSAGSHPAVISAPSSSPDADCPRIVCDPTHDYGQPSLAMLKGVESRIGSSAATTPTAAQSASGTSSSSTPGGTSSSQASVTGPAGPAGPARAPGPAGPAGASAASFAGYYQKYKGSIAHFLTLKCSDNKEYVGSGFVIAPNLVATAAHVVYGQKILQLAIGGKVVSGRTIGIDRGRDVALVRLSGNVSATTVPLATAWPAVGSPLAVLGYAQGGIGGPLSMQQGHVSAVNITLNGGPGYIETDTAEDHGSSGGPVLDANGKAVAIVSTTIGDAGLVKLQAGSIGAAAAFATWRTHPQNLPTPC